MTQTPHHFRPQAPVPTPGKRLAAAALALGLCSLIPFVGVFCAVLAIIFSITVLAKSAPGRSKAIAGLALAALGVLESSALTFLILREYDYDIGRAKADFFYQAGDPRPWAACPSNLRTIGEHVYLYMEYYQVPPPSVSVLVNFRGMPAKVLECPDAHTPGKASVFVLFPRSGDVPETTIIACDYRGNHPDGRNVLNFRGTVTFIKSEAAFQTELAKPENAAFAAALRAKEGP